MGEYGPGQHPSSRANLVPFTGAGDPRRRHGAPAIGRSITAMMNELGRDDDEGNAVYGEDALKKIAADLNASHSRVIAAREILRARLEGFDKIGRIPQAANSLDRLLDRTDGKPVQTIRVEREPSRPAAEIRAEIAAFIAANPELVEGFEPPINTTAEEIPEKKELPDATRAAEDTAIKNIAKAGKAKEAAPPSAAQDQPTRRPESDSIDQWM